MAYQPLSSLSFQGSGGLLGKAQPTPINTANPFSLGVKPPAAQKTPLVYAPNIGVKARSPQDNVKNPVTSLPASQTQTQKPVVNQSTQNPSSGTGMTSDQVKSNLSTYYQANPQASTNPAYQTGGQANGASSAVGTNPSGTAAPVNPYGDSLYGKALFAQQQAQNTATNFNAGLNQEVTNIKSNPNYIAPIAEGRAGLVAQTGAIQGQRLADLATNAQNAATQAFGLQYGTPAEAAVDSGANGGTGSSLNPVNNISFIAQQVISGALSPSQAYAMGGNVANFQGALDAEIQKQSPGANTATLQGQYDAKQSNTTTAGTAPTSAAASLYTQTYPQLAQLKTTTANIDQFGNLLLGTMVAKDGTTINPSDSKYANDTISQVRNQLSSPQQAQFDTTFAQLKAQIANLLSTGGAQIPTQTSNDANAIINGTAPIGTLSATLQRIATEGNILTQNLQGQLNSAGSVIGAPAQSTSGTTSSGLTYTITP